MNFFRNICLVSFTLFSLLGSFAIYALDCEIEAYNTSGECPQSFLPQAQPPTGWEVVGSSTFSNDYLRTFDSLTITRQDISTYVLTCSYTVADQPGKMFKIQIVGSLMGNLSPPEVEKSALVCKQGTTVRRWQCGRPENCGNRTTNNVNDLKTVASQKCALWDVGNATSTAFGAGGDPGEISLTQHSCDGIPTQYRKVQ